MPIVDSLKTRIRSKSGNAYGVHTIDQAVKELNRVEDNPLSALLVDATIAADTDLLGKVVSDLQSNIVIANHAASGTLKYVTGYTGFSGDPAEQKGYYIALYSRVPDVTGVTIKVKVKGGREVETTLDADGICVFRMINDKAIGKSIVVTASKEGVPSLTRVISLDNLVCEKEVG